MTKGTLVALITFVLAVSTAFAQSGATLEGVLRQVRPVLQLESKVGRIYFRGICVGGNGVAPAIEFRPIHIVPPKKGLAALATIRGMFFFDESALISEAPAGVIRITIGAVPRSILKTKIHSLVFNKVERYNVYPAIGALLDAPEVRNATKKARTKLMSRADVMSMQEPMKGVPHLPGKLQNVSVDAALDIIAEKFSGIIIYGVCENKRKFSVDYYSLDD